MPKLPAGATAACLSVRLRATLPGHVFDPAVQIAAGSFCDTQYFARGVSGVRHLNLSRLLHSGVREGDLVQLHCRRLTLPERKGELVIDCEKVTPEDRILVVAPHPDDAELSAFGLYTDTKAVVVTLTAGDASNQYNGRNGSVKLTRHQLARLRVVDSLQVPQLAGLPRENTVCLCYPDSLLHSMHGASTRDFSQNGAGHFDFAGLRALNTSRLLRDNAVCTWNSLVMDLAHLIGRIQPTIIVTPDPWHDPHPDHVAATLAVCDALSLSQRTDGRFFLTNVHNKWSELYPLGPAGAGVPIPHRAQGGAPESSGFYSHALSPERQFEKYLALEAMHDIRELTGCPPYDLAYLWRRFRIVAGSFVHGLGTPPTSSLRRAVRPDEIFLILKFEELLKLRPKLQFPNDAFSGGMKRST